jgi:hypothetical protein
MDAAKIKVSIKLSSEKSAEEYTMLLNKWSLMKELSNY